MYGNTKLALAAAATLAAISQAAPIEARGAPSEITGPVNFVYWGADSKEQSSLSSYCGSKSGVDFLNLAFVNDFGNSADISATFGPSCSLSGGKASSGCGDLGKEIAACQHAGTRVLVSIGGWGANGPQYTLTSQSDAENLATQLWDYFGNGGKNIFGNVAVNGIDFDIESSNGANYYQYAVSKYRALADKVDHFITAAPMCVTDDTRLLPAINNSPFDYLNVQFYNNAGSAWGQINGKGDMTFDAWYKQIQSGVSAGAKINIGLVAPGGTTDTKDNWLSPSDTATIVNDYKSHSGYGGTMIWSAGWSDSSVVNGCNYAQNVHSIINTGKPC